MIIVPLLNPNLFWNNTGEEPGDMAADNKFKSRRRNSPEPMREAMDWLRRYERFWSGSLDRLPAYGEGKEAEARERRR
jgi:hypothetical protein